MLEPNADQEYRCYYIGQTISWRNSNFTCLETDILFPDQAIILKETLLNLGSFISSFLKVDPIENEWVPKLSFPNHFKLDPKNVSADLFVVIAVRPFNGVGSATTHGILRKKDDNRVIQCVIYFFVGMIPMKTESEFTYSKKLFNLAFHELMHSLGFSMALYRLWINPSTGKAYGDDLPFSNISLAKYPNKHFLIIHTPTLHKMAFKKFGKEYFFDGLVPAGLEIEDSGPSGTYAGHPDGRIYLGDPMASVPFQVTKRISDLNFALLNDTGWYDVDFTKSNKLSWGDGFSFGDSLLNNFPDHPPQTHFPLHYLCRNNFTKPRCSHDYKGIGLCNSNKIDCKNTNLNQDQKRFCESQEWSNPLGLDYMGAGITSDFMIYVKTTIFCDNPELKPRSNGEYHGENSFCHSNSSSLVCLHTVCNDDDTISITINNIKQICKFEGQILFFENPKSNITCSSPKHICRIIKFDTKNVQYPYDFPNFIKPTNLSDIKSFNLLNSKIFPILSFIGLFLISIFIFHFFFQKKNSQNLSDELNNNFI